MDNKARSYTYNFVIFCLVSSTCIEDFCFFLLWIWIALSVFKQLISYIRIVNISPTVSMHASLCISLIDSLLYLSVAVDAEIDVVSKIFCNCSHCVRLCTGSGFPIDAFIKIR